METTKPQNRQIVFLRTFNSFLATALIILMLAGCAGDTRMGSGAKTVAIIGAGIGLLVGIASGDANKATAATAGLPPKN